MITEYVPSDRQPSGRAGPSHLSPRENEVLRGIADGLSNIEIGLGLDVSEDTVKSHVCRLLRKLGARNRAHAVHLAHRRGLLGGDR